MTEKMKNSMKPALAAFFALLSACVVMPEFSGNDYDGDGVPVEEDCDDRDAESLTLAEDGDCDG